MAADSSSDEEKKIFDYILNGDFDGVRMQFSNLNCNVDIVDEHGMTPLCHAAFKGNVQIGRYLLDQGADVNCDKHEHKYTPLHFAVLSGNVDMCLLLLESGAKPYHINSVGRTPSQMGGFVGNQLCASIINNYVPISDIEHFTQPNVNDIQISPKSVSPLHKLIMQTNIHPNRVALNLTPHLLPELKYVAKVLKKLCVKEMSKGTESNELLSMKYHYLHFIVLEIMKYSSVDKQNSDPVELFIKKVIRSNRGDEYLDSIIREAVREYPYREVPFFIQVVSELAAMKDQVGSALSVLRGAINGEHNMSDENVCATCCEPNPPKRCSKCKEIRYCDRECQRLHWSTHKKECCRTAPSPEHIAEKLENLQT